MGIDVLLLKPEEASELAFREFTKRPKTVHLLMARLGLEALRSRNSCKRAS